MMTLRARTIAALFLAGWILSTALPAAAQNATIFRFEIDAFWLNLHHFLYVLGRAEAKEQDATGGAVAGAPAEVEKGLASLTDDERQQWRAAVTAYAGGLSKKDTVFELAALTAATARAGDAATLANQPGIDTATRATLEGVAPIYRRVWWPAHRASHQAWRTAMQPHFSRHGPAIVDFLTKAFGQTWPMEGYPVRLSMYANWAGAYSTDEQLIVVATNGGARTSGLDGLEIVFHESMHQWEGTYETIQELARANKVPEQPNLSHALIFFTAGEAVKRVVSEHVPYAEAHGIWKGRMGTLKPPMDQAWKPYLQGPSLGDKTARDAAIAAVLKNAPPPPPPRPTPPASPR
jgi:hypothetical protein